MRYPAICYACVVMQLVACTSPDGPARTFAVRDSAGVQIVESHSPAWDLAETWRVDSIPDVDVSENADEELFRIESARLLPGGGFVFFNGGACEVRFHAPSGEHLTSTGRCGKGPGEFDEFGGLWPWRGDSIVVVDQLMRVTVLAGNGRLGRTAQLPTAADMPLPFIRGVLDDGTFVVAGLRDPMGRSSPGVDTGQSTLGLLPSLEDTPNVTRIYPGPVFEYTEFNGGLGRGRFAFSSSTEFVAGGRNAFAGLPDRYEIQVYSAEGHLQRIIRRAFTPVHVEQRDIDWLLDRRLTQVEGEDNQRIVRQAFRSLRHAAQMPAFGTPVWPGGAEGGPAMLVDAEGNLWVFVHYRPGEYRNDWTVFSSDGVWLGTVTLPQRLTPSEVGRNVLIGSWEDETGFRHIRRHRIIKP